MKILAIYDLSRFPNTFDFLTYLQTLSLRISNINDRVTLLVCASDFRVTTAMEKLHFSNEYHEGKFNTVIAPIASSIKFVECIQFTFRPLRLKDFDSLYPFDHFPHKPLSYSYSTRSVIDNFISGSSRKLYPLQMRRLEFLSPIIKEPYITLSLRTARHNQLRNTPLDFWFEIYKIISVNWKIIVIPDFDDVIGDRMFEKYEWNSFPEASVNLYLREALYRNAFLNTGWVGGHTSILDYSDYPFLNFGRYVPGVVESDLDFFRRKGPDFGEQPNFLSSNQKYDWTAVSDLTIDYVMNEINGKVEKLSLKN